MSFLKKLKTAIVISRPASWIFGPAAYLLGLVIRGDEFTLLNVVQILLLSFPLGFYMCGINDAYDIKTDRINKRKGNALWGATITEKDVPWIKQASLLVVALIFLSTLPTGNIAHILSTLFLLPIPYLYSAPPVRLKARPVLD
ncbi:TPA: hypothetical protein EYP38_04405, partial [Candidatus Micrarchaeota archaeon]|nr:hypothetical protein [Candidatus Micrarchaeota archaeon]